MFVIIVVYLERNKNDFNYIRETINKIIMAENKIPFDDCIKVFQHWKIKKLVNDYD